MHDVITIGVPLIAILFGVLINQQGLRDLRASIDTRFNAIDARLDRMQADLAGFYRTIGEHDAEIINLKDRSKS